MSRTLSDPAARRLEALIDTDLLGEAEPSVLLHEFNTEDEPLGSGEFMAAHLTKQLRARRLQLEVRTVEPYYFDLGPYSGISGKICFLGLYDLATGTRRLFTLGAYNPGMKWMPEQNSGPRFEEDRRFQLGNRRQCELQKMIPDAAASFVAPMAAKVRAFVERQELTEEQQYDLSRYLRRDKLKFEDLIYIALALGTTLEAILAEDAV